MKHKFQSHPADKFCRRTIDRLPKSLEFADMFRRDRTIIAGERPCPGWCALPSSFVASVIAGTNDKQAILQAHELDFTYELTAALIWSRNKMIYRFDGTLADMLAAQSLDSPIPSEILDFLPYPCVFIERNMTLAGYETTGFFAWLDWGTKENIRLLRLQFLRPDDKPLPLCVPILGGTIQESILELANKHSKTGAGNFTEKDVKESPVAQSLIECINLLLYLCSEKPDMPDDTELHTHRRRDTYGNPKRAAEWDVGLRIGAALRKASGEKAENPDAEDKAPTDKKQHSSPRPHLRRAHWHSFWTGKRGSPERKLTLQWLPPIAVNVNDVDLPTVVHPVKM